MPRKNKRYEAEIAYARTLGVEGIGIVREHSHPELVGSCNGNRVAASLGSSKLGDWRTPLNFRRDLRHEVMRARGFDVPHRHHAHMPRIRQEA